jgi:hypothetical protein
VITGAFFGGVRVVLGVVDGGDSLLCLLINDIHLLLTALPVSDADRMFPNVPGLQFEVGIVDWRTTVGCALHGAAADCGPLIDA